MIVRKNIFFSVVRIFSLIVVGLVVALVVALSQINLDTLRGNIVSGLQNATGLPIQVDGSVSWKLSLQPKIEFHKVHVANADWAKNKYAYSAEKIDVRLNLISLFRNRPTIQNVKMYDVNINIEKNKNGDYSVPGFKPKEPVAAQANTVSVPDKYPVKNIGLGAIEIKNINVNILQKKYSLSGLNIRMIQKKDKREYSGWIKIDKDVSSFILSMSEYNAERKIYPVQVAVSTGVDALIANIALEGTSKLPIDFIIKGDTPNADTVGKFFGIKLPHISNMHVNIAGGFDRNKITLRKSSLVINDTEFVISGDYSWAKNTPVINANIYSSYLDLATLFPKMYGRHRKHVNRPLNAFKDVPLFGSVFVNKDANIRVELDTFVMYRNLSIKNLDLSLDVHDNHIRVDSELLFASGDVNFAINADVDNDGHLFADVGFRGKKLFVGQILNELNVNNFVSDLPVNIELYVKTNGKDLSDLMNTITGPVYLYSVGAGYAHSDLVAYMYGTDFLTSLRHSVQDLFSSEKKYNQITISCMALNAMLRDGVFETQNGFAVETNAINLRLAGNLDLGDENMKLSLTTVPVRGLKLSLTGKVVNSIELTGSLAEPDIKISGASVASKVASATGLGLLLAPITGGIGLVASTGIGLVAGDLLENWLADGKPCETALRNGVELYHDDPDWMNIPVDELVSSMLNKD